MGKKSVKAILHNPISRWFSSLHKNTKLAISLVSVLVLVGGLSFLFTRSSEITTLTNEEPTEIAEIETAEQIDATLIYSEGTVEFRTLETDWDIAELDLQIIQGMDIRTVGAISKAVIGLEDGSEIRLDANSSIAISSMTAERVIVKQFDGYVFSRTAPSDTRDYIIETKNSQFQSVGTSFRTITTGDEEAVEVYQSRIKEVITNTEAVAGKKIVVEEQGTEITTITVDINIEELKKNEFIQWNRDRDAASALFRDKLGFLSDFEGPVITITDPQPSSTIQVDPGLSPVVTISGKTEADAKITVQSKSVSGAAAQEVSQNDDGSFTTPELPAAFGISVFEFIATDRRGNITTTNFNFTFSRQVTAQEQGIALSVTQTDTEIKLEWGLVGLTAPDGVKIVYGTETNPTYPLSTSFLEKSKKNFTLKKSELTPEETYYFRVCRYNEALNSCDIYSNQSTITLPDIES